MIQNEAPLDDALRQRLHRRLEAVAGDELLDAHYRVIDSPVGALLLVATDKGVVRVAFEREDHDRVLDDLAARIGPRLLRTPTRLDETARELDRYFAGDGDPTGVRLDLRLATGFRRTVLERLRQVPYGGRISYAALAAEAGSPKAVRATGSACATNPLPLLVPCHRVVRSDGAIGQYLGGTEAKVALLELESRPSAPRREP